MLKNWEKEKFGKVYGLHSRYPSVMKSPFVKYAGSINPLTLAFPVLTVEE
jgi:hypothetical protein